jgi:hypothetical protein
MLLDAHDAVVPVGMIGMVAGWLRAHGGEQAAPLPATGAPPLRTVLVNEAVQESAIFLDDTQTLFGLVSAPAGGTTPPSRAIVLLNSGAIHHIGPNRLYVTLARRWAARGCLVIRLDQAGIGDSLPRPGEPENVVYAAGAVTDAREAIEYLHSRLNVSTIHAAGLCSGAYHALKAAVAGAPLEGIGVVNPLVFFWKAGMSLAYPTYRVSEATAAYRRSMFRLEKWKKLFTGRVDLGAFVRIMGRRAGLKSGALARNIARSLGRPMADDLGAELTDVVRRGVAVDFLFSAGDPGEDLLKVEAGWTLPSLLRDRSIRIQRIVGPNHTFTPVWSHAALTQALEAALKVP